MTGKGDTYRPVDWDKWSKNYDRIKWGARADEIPESYGKPVAWPVPPHRSGGCMDNLRGTNGSKETE